MVINDIFVDDHRHYWSIREELSRMTPDRNPLTNLPFEPSEWERMSKALEWTKKKEVVEQTLPPPPVVSMVDQPPIREMETSEGFRWFCCPNICSWNIDQERYHVKCDLCTIVSKRENGNYPGECTFTPCCICYEGGDNHSLFAPLCCLCCFYENSCMFRTKTTGFLCPCGWSYENKHTGTDYTSAFCCIQCCSNTLDERSCIFTPLFCYHKRHSWDCYLTPLCLDVNGIYLSPIVCSNTKLYFFLGIPVCRI
jgi:hypothetical protein